MKANRAPAHSPIAPTTPKPPKAESFSAAEYPDLRSFLRGYLHEDMKDEYGSPEEAAREFCSDASGEEHAAVAEQWSRFLAQTRGQTMEDINRILTGPLGSAYALTEEDVPKLSAVFSPPARKQKNS